MQITTSTPASLPQPMHQHDVGEKLEQAFLEEMLKYCGPRANSGNFSGGHGEEQFESFLAREYATALAARLELNVGFRGREVAR